MRNRREFIETAAACARVAVPSPIVLFLASACLFSGVSLSPSYAGETRDTVILDYAKTPRPEGWKIDGYAFGTRSPNLKHRQKAAKASRNQRQYQSGTMTSPEFVIDRDYMEIVCSGVLHPTLCTVRLVVDGKDVRSCSPEAGSGFLGQGQRATKYRFDLRPLKGKNATIEVRENHANGYLDLVTIVATDRKPPVETKPIGTVAAGRKPNIIFIMVDDLGYHDLGCLGSRTILTPNIDKMCAEGMKFTDCYGGCTVCAPSRSVLMTGYHKGHTPVRDNRGGIPLFPEDVTVAEVLKKAGYATGGFGKWGLGNQGKKGAAERQGFDVFFGYYNQWHAHSYYTHLFRNSVKVELDGRYTHYAIYDETIQFIKENKDRPFFCYCTWTVPHGPYQIPEDDPAWTLYKDRPWPKDAKVVAAMDSMIDRQVGEMIDLLKTLRIDDDTITFFASDNGGARRFEGIHDSCGEMRGQKRSMYEGGIRVPMIARWPGRIKAGTVSDLPWYFPDVMPTLAELAGLSEEVPEDIDGISIVPTLLGKGQQKRHEYLYWDDTWYHNEGVRMGKWKGVRSNGKFEVNPNVELHRGKWKGMKHESGKVEVYDLSKDRGEKNNLADEYPEIAKKLGELMDEAWVEPRSQKDDGVYTGK